MRSRPAQSLAAFAIRHPEAPARIHTTVCLSSTTAGFENHIFFPLINRTINIVLLGIPRYQCIFQSFRAATFRSHHPSPRRCHQHHKTWLLIWTSSSKWALTRRGPNWQSTGLVIVSSHASRTFIASFLTVWIVQGALEWLEDNQDKSLEEIQASQEAEDEEAPALKPGEEARSLVCNECGKKFRSQAQAEFHASKTEHTDFSESTEELAPLTEEQKKERLEELRQKLATKRAAQAEQDKIEQRQNEVRVILENWWAG